MSYPGEREGKVLTKREAPMVVDYEQLTVSGDGVTFVAEASTIGLAPGQWPTVLTVMRGTEVVGNFLRRRSERDGAVVVYEGASHELHVLND